MTETLKLESLFSDMVPVRSGETDRNSNKGSGPRFRLFTNQGEPFLSLMEDGDTKGYTANESRLAAEIRRLSLSPRCFGLSADMQGMPCVSIWENPYLVNLMHGVSLEGADGNPITFSPLPAYVMLRMKDSEEEGKTDAGFLLKTPEDCRENFTFIDETTVLSGSELYRVKTVGTNYSRLKGLIAEVDKDVVESYLSLVLSYASNITVEYNGVPAVVSKVAEHAVPTLFLEKVAADKALYLRVGSSLESLKNRLPPSLEPTSVARLGPDGKVTVYPVAGCDLEGSAEILASLINSSAPNREARKDLFRDGHFFIIPEETAGPFLLRCLPQVLAQFRLVGSEKLREYKVVAATPKLNLKLSSGIDFLEGEGDIIIGEDTFSINDFLRQYAKKKYVELSDGSRGIIDEAYIMRLQRLFRRRGGDGRIRVTLFDLPEVEELLKHKVSGPIAGKSRSILEGFNLLGKARVPEYDVKATLRPYQEEGVKWMKYLYDNELGGCLADDMGLGKTLQTIALLSMIYPRCKKPSMIVMPRSLLFNWEKELVSFAPGISFHTYYGPDRNLGEALKANVVLTTYGMVRNDILRLKEHEFECVVLDESQNIKNTGAQTTMAVQLLVGRHRFALSGTPMENNLTELYSLFSFLNPTMFGSREDFNASYTYPIMKYGDKDATESLRRKIFPFILRRLKRDVLEELPPRIDLTRFVEMSEAQKRLYEERRLSYRQQIGETIARDGIRKAQFTMLQALTELRRIASVPESVAGGGMKSPKIEALMESLTEAVGNGHKSIVFFNYLAGLESVMDRLDRLGIPYETMTGSTPAGARKEIVERFQADPECMVMLLTLKVGGVGLNLTAADTVFIFEPWWNKAAEEQAINRLHRIGQKSTVSSFSLITVGTIEEKILQLQEQKRALFNELISADSSMSKVLSEKDIDFILS